MKRRSFLKTTALVGTAASVAPVFKGASFTAYGKPIMRQTDKKVPAAENRAAEEIGLKIESLSRGNHPHIVFRVKDKFAGKTELCVFTLNGTRIWSSQELLWDGTAQNGEKMGSGTYLYSVRAGDTVVRGKFGTSLN